MILTRKAARSNRKTTRSGSKTAPRRKGAPRATTTAVRVVHPVCCGVDVHKKLIVCTIARSEEGTMAASYEQRTFSTKWSDLIESGDWLAESGCGDVCMESTGKYWMPVYNVLEGTCRVVVANPKHARAIRGKKTDSKDPAWIADLFRLGLVVPSFIPPKDIRDAREISRYIYKLACVQASERNRYQNCLTVANSTLSNVLSDAFGKTARSVMKRVLEAGRLKTHSNVALSRPPNGCASRPEAPSAGSAEKARDRADAWNPGP